METWAKRVFQAVKVPLAVVIIGYIGYGLVVLLMPYLGLPAYYYLIANRVLTIILIVATVWIFLKIVSVLEDLLTKRYRLLAGDDLMRRVAYTKILVLKRVIVSLVILLAFAAILMTFENVRQLGISILASAGFVSILLGIAAQKTLATLFSGLQIALTQPIKIDDAVVIENEFGNIEEITLTNVVVRLWDQRRLVVPVSYFLDRPFQNWTRTSTALLGTIFLYVDYIMPIDLLRDELNNLLNKSKYWDGRIGILEVTDCKENTLELRIIVSAADAGKTWALRCEVREGLITYIRDNYPECWPKIRIISES